VHCNTNNLLRYRLPIRRWKFNKQEPIGGIVKINRHGSQCMLQTFKKTYREKVDLKDKMFVWLSSCYKKLLQKLLVKPGVDSLLALNLASFISDINLWFDIFNSYAISYQTKILS
jgi:hypothetical protein